MKKIKQPGFFNLSWLGGKTTYTEDKWLGGEEDPRGDRGRLEDFYLNHGYVTARIGQPKITYTDGKPGCFKKKPVKLMRLEIPVTEGEQYRMGELKFEGLTVLKEDVRPRLLQDEAGRRLQRLEVQEGLREAARRLRQPRLLPVDGRHAEEARPREEGRRRHGADGGGQAVLRRADQLHRQRLDAGQGDPARDLHERGRGVQHRGPQDVDQARQPARLLQADGGRARHPPSEIADNKVDVTFKVEEQNRNQFTFGGGVSGLRGHVPQRVSFSTTNFLGRRRDRQLCRPDRQPHEELLARR